jgi:hypothetical protein
MSKNEFKRGKRGTAKPRVRAAKQPLEFIHFVGGSSGIKELIAWIQAIANM